MKRKSLLIIALIAIAISASAQMDNLSNMSAKWIRSNVRNASLDGGADMVNYNPAGLAMLDDGLYISVSNQMLFRHPQHTFNFGAGSVMREQDGMDPFLPMLYGAYKMDKMAFSTGVYISGGGASVNYPEGSFNTALIGYSLLPLMAEAAGYTSFKDQYLEASSFYITIPLGFSYAINDNFAVSLGGRYLMGKNKTKAGLTFTGSPVAPDNTMDVDYKSSANGFGGVIGLDFKPMDKLNIAIHYETKVKLDFEASDNAGTLEMEENGEKNRRDLPAALNTGISYKLTDNLTAALDLNYYFQKSADWDTIWDPTNGNDFLASEVAGDCIKIALGFMYDVNDKLQLSLGGNMTDYQYDNMELYYTKLGIYEVLKYDNLNLSLGLGYNITENIQVDLGLMKTFWKDQTINSLNAGIPVDVNSAATVIAIGVDFRF